MNCFVLLCRKDKPHRTWLPLTKPSHSRYTISTWQNMRCGVLGVGRGAWVRGIWAGGMGCGWVWAVKMRSRRRRTKKTGSDLEEHVSQGKGDHGLNHGHSPGHHTGVMAALGHKLHFLALPVHSLLPLGDGRGWLEGNPDHDVLSIGQTPLHPTRPTENCTKPYQSVSFRTWGTDSPSLQWA